MFTVYEAFWERLQFNHPHWSAATVLLFAVAPAREATAGVASPLELARLTLQAVVAEEDTTVACVLRDL